jgi:hypothetical protein
VSTIGHWTRQRVFHRPARFPDHEFRVVDVNGVAAGHRAHHHRHVGVVPVADAHRLAIGEVHTVETFDEGRHEMAPGLLAVGDDIDARVLLVEQRQADRVALALRQRVALELPRGPQLAGLGEPGGLGEAAGDGGGKKRHTRRMP